MWGFIKIALDFFIQQRWNIIVQYLLPMIVGGILVFWYKKRESDIEKAVKDLLDRKLSDQEKEIGRLNAEIIKLKEEVISFKEIVEVTSFKKQEQKIKLKDEVLLIATAVRNFLSEA